MNQLEDILLNIMRRLTDVEDRMAHISAIPIGGGSPAIQHWQDAPLENNWVNYGSGWETAQYYKDTINVIRIKGFVKSGTSGFIFTLPVGYRPDENIMLGVLSNRGVVQMQIIASTGVVLTTALLPLDWISIHCSFRAA